MCRSLFSVDKTVNQIDKKFPSVYIFCGSKLKSQLISLFITDVIKGKKCIWINSRAFDFFLYSFNILVPCCLYTEKIVTVLEPG